MLIDEIKKANIEALKAHDTNKRSILGVVMNKYKLLEVENRTKEKDTTDVDLQNIIAKTIKELDDEIEGYLTVNNNERAALIKEQQDIIKTYLPKQMSEDEIKAEIAKLDDKSIPSIMKHFKANFNGKCDMGLVNKIAHSL